MLSSLMPGSTKPNSPKQKFLIGKMLDNPSARNVYETDPVLVSSGIEPEFGATPMDDKELRYFVRVANHYLSLRPTPEEEEEMGWEEVRPCIEIRVKRISKYILKRIIIKRALKSTPGRTLVRTLGRTLKHPLKRTHKKTHKRILEHVFQAEMTKRRQQHREKHLSRLIKEAEELHRAWMKLSGQFLQINQPKPLDSEEPPKLRLSIGEIEALALLLRVISCRCDHPVWYGYCIALEMALRGIYMGKARGYLRDPENAAGNYLMELLIKRVDTNALPQDPGEREEAIKKGTPILWKYNPSKKFMRYFNITSRNHRISVNRKKDENTQPLDEKGYSTIPSNVSTEGDKLFDDTLDPEMDLFFGMLTEPLNSMRLHPDILKEKIRALQEAQREAEKGLTSKEDIEKRRNDTRIQVIALEEMDRGWRSHKEVLESANKRIKRDLGAGSELKGPKEKELYWGCVDQFILRCVEEYGVDPSLIDFYLVYRRPKSYKRSSEVKAQMDWYLQEID
jgi:hypothetical protein